MKIQIERKVLSDALEFVAPLSGKSKVLPILENVKVVTKGDRLRLQCSDSVNTVRKYVRAIKVTEDCEFLVDCKNLFDLVKSLKCDIVDIEVDLKERMLTLTHSTGSAQMPAPDPKDFPDIVNKEIEAEVDVPSSLFYDACEYAPKFAGNNELTKPQLTHIYMYVENNAFGYCCTDESVLITEENPLDGTVPDCGWLVNPFCAGLLKLVCKEADSVNVKISQGNIQYKIGDAYLSHPVPEVKYPAFKRVLPVTFEGECEVNVKDMTSAVLRAASFTNKDRDCMKVHFGRTETVIEAEYIEYAKKSSERVQCGCNAEMMIGLSAGRLKRGLDVFKGRDIVMQFNDKSRPVVLRDKTAPSRMVLIMPMMV
jgi:DNA polymerase-3 subunit beta